MVRKGVHNNIICWTCNIWSEINYHLNFHRLTTRMFLITETILTLLGRHACQYLFCNHKIRCQYSASQIPDRQTAFNTSTGDKQTQGIQVATIIFY